MVTKSKRTEKCKKCGALRLVSIKCPELTPCLNCGKDSGKLTDKVKKVMKEKK